MPRKNSFLWGVFLALFFSLLSFYPVLAEGDNPTPCQFQPPATDRTPTVQNVRRIDKGTSGNITWDETYIGLHRWNTGQWPGVDFWVPTTVAFKNGGSIRMATWDDAGGGYSLFIDGEGPCQGWYIFIGHLAYNPAERYSQGQHIGPDEVVGEPGCSGFTCSQALPAHNHYALGYNENIFSFADGTVPAYAGGHYWIHPARVEGTTSALPVAQATQEAFVENIEEVAVMDSTNGGNMIDLYTLELAEGTRLPFSIPLWAYATAGIGMVVLFSKRYRPLGLACVIATAVLVVGFYQAQAKSANAAEAQSQEVPPQMVDLQESDIIAIDEVLDLTEPDPTPTPDPNLAGKPSKNPADYPLNNGPCEVSSKFPSKVLQWCGLITYYAGQRDLDVNLIAAVILQESGGNPEACNEEKGHMVIDGISICGSRDGAIGLMQVMPRDGISGSKYTVFVNRPSALELLNPEFNIIYGTGMLMRLGASNDAREALFHYGPSGSGYRYADIVLTLYNRYK